MSKTSSVILVDEKVLPDHAEEGNGDWYTSALNGSMLAMFNARETREGQWRRLLDQAGFEVRKIRRVTELGIV